jgi:predicted protein tyrosine phosphatase
MLITAHGPQYVVTLRSPGDPVPPLPFAADRHLVLCVNDITAPRPGLVAPDAAMMTRMLGFAQSWDGVAPLLVTCFAGISRSTAAAYCISCLHAAPGSEDRLARQLRARAPTATPNARMITLADELLGRAGRMVDAIAAIGRGSEASSGAPFTLEIG